MCRYRGSIYNCYLSFFLRRTFLVFSSFFFRVSGPRRSKSFCLNRDSYHYIPATKVIPTDYVIIREAMETIGRIERYNDFPIETK